MAYTTINKSTDHFNTLAYSGTASTNAVTGVGFQPDWVWIKQRTGSTPHKIFDSVRGTGKSIKSNSSDGEATNEENGYLSAFGSDGFTVTAGSTGSDDVNASSGSNYVSWNWLANGSGVANTDGSISSTVSANTTSGFSIVSFTGNGTGNSTIGHGLNSTPKFIIVKRRSSAQDWGTYSPSFVSVSDPNIVYLSKTSAQADDTNVWGTSATFNNNTFTVGDWAGSNSNGDTFIAYCFAEKPGYSKMGSYTGNGNDNGVFTYTGFSPAFVMIKLTSGVDNWILMDNKRLGYNGANYQLLPNSSLADQTPERLDLLSNGFKCRNGNGEVNGSGQTYIYMAFGQSIVGSNNVPATAR